MGCAKIKYPHLAGHDSSSEDLIAKIVFVIWQIREAYLKNAV